MDLKDWPVVKVSKNPNGYSSDIWEKQAAATLRRKKGPGSIERRYSCVINLHCHLRFFIFIFIFLMRSMVTIIVVVITSCPAKLCQEMACCGESQEPEDQEVRTFVAGEDGGTPKVMGRYAWQLGINIWEGFLRWGISKTIGFNTKMVIHDLDDLGVPPWLRKPPYGELTEISMDESFGNCSYTIWLVEFDQRLFSWG